MRKSLYGICFSLVAVAALTSALLPSSRAQEQGRAAANAQAAVKNPQAAATQNDRPLTSAELVSLVRRLPARPELKEEVATEIRRRGIGFPLTNGMRSVVATKSGNDATLLRILDEAERRRTGAFVPPPPAAPAEAEALLERARKVALEQAGQMPDFIVKQQIARSNAYGTTKNWIPADRLTIAVTYRESAGEQYKLLAINGLPAPAGEMERGSYEHTRGTSSTGEFVSLLVNLFAVESEAKFQPVGTDTLRGVNTIVYDFEVARRKSKQLIKFGGGGTEGEQATTAGRRGKVWIDRESARVRRIENMATEIPEDFPIRAVTNRIDYDWTEIDGRRYLLPLLAEIEFTTNVNERIYQSRNVIRFRNYQKFGSKVEVLEDDFDEPPPSDNPR